jgi:copper chaperone CopZ
MSGTREGATAGARSYTVAGMTCGHCRAAVTEDIGKVRGVTAVEVDLTTGRVTVSGDGFTDAGVGAAVDEAGYQVVRG